MKLQMLFNRAVVRSLLALSVFTLVDPTLAATKKGARLFSEKTGQGHTNKAVATESTESARQIASACSKCRTVPVSAEKTYQTKRKRGAVYFSGDGNTRTYLTVKQVCVGCADVSTVTAGSAVEVSHKLIAAYTKVSAALVADDLASARKSATDLKTLAESAKQTPLAKAASEVASAESLKSARAAFKDVSTQLVGLVDGHPCIYVMTCPMAKADWVQTDKTVANPYMGKGMPKCGMIKKDK